MSKDNSCPAFPFQIDHNTANTEYCYGMTLRDYFAAKAMQGFAVSENQSWVGGESGMAETCYMWADALLAERSKP